MRGFILMLLLCLSCSADEYRTFTDLNGRETKAKILKVDARSGKVTLERENGRKVSVPGKVFSAKDQNYFREWVAVQDFLSPSRLKISIKKMTSDGQKFGYSNGITKKGEGRRYYDVVLSNTGSEDLKRLYFEYRIYGTQDEMTKIVEGTSERFNVLSKCRVSESTKEFEMYSYHRQVSESYTDSYGYTQTESYQKKTHEDEVDGVCVRVCCETSSGEKFVREVCLPSDIAKKYPW